MKNKGKYLEDAVALSLTSDSEATLSESLFYDSAKGGADFIVQLGDKKIVLEIGFGNKGAGQALATMNKIGASYGIVISEDPLSFDKPSGIVKMPLEMFLMVGNQ